MTSAQLKEEFVAVEDNNLFSLAMCVNYLIELVELLLDFIPLRVMPMSPESLHPPGTSKGLTLPLFSLSYLRDQRRHAKDNGLSHIFFQQTKIKSIRIIKGSLLFYSNR